MSSTRRRVLLYLLLTVLPTCAIAQSYPSRPIRMIVSAGPGGGTDFVARVMLSDLSRLIGQSIVIDNRGGSAGAVAGRLAASAPADGYTILMMTSNFATFPSLYKDLGYDPVDDFALISQLAVVPLVLAVHPSVPAKSVKELIAYAKSVPGNLNYAAPGVGSMGHLAAEQFKRMAGIDMRHVAYKGGGPSIIALVAGEVQLYFSTLPAALGQLKAGRIRAIAITSEKRSRIAPELPTVAETGLAGFEAASWFGMVAPKGTPAAILDKWFQASSATLQDKAVVGRLAGEGMEPIGNKPQEFRAQFQSEVKKWAEVIRGANITAQ